MTRDTIDLYHSKLVESSKLRKINKMEHLLQEVNRTKVYLEEVIVAIATTKTTKHKTSSSYPKYIQAAQYTDYHPKIAHHQLLVIL